MPPSPSPSAASVNADPRPLHGIPFLAGASAADPTGWGDAGLHIAAWSEDGPDATPSSEFSTEARVAWTESGIAVLVRMRSGVPWHEAADKHNAFEADSLEIFLRPGSSSGSTTSVAASRVMVQAVISPGMASDQGAARSAVWDHRQPAADWSGIPTAITVTRTKFPDGCVIAALMPLAQVRATSGRGVVVEFRLLINKILPGKGRRQFSWRAPSGDEFHRLEFADHAGAAVTSSAWAVLDGYDRLAIAAVVPVVWMGRSAIVTQAGVVLASSSFQASTGDSRTAVLSTHTLASALGDASHPVEIASNGVLLGTNRVQDPRLKARRDLERSSMRGFARTEPGAFDPLTRVRPRVPVLLRRGALPAAIAPDAAMLTLAGAGTMRTRWFQRDGTETTEAITPGRHGAVIALTMDDGSELRFHRTAVLLPEGAKQASDAVLEIAAAAVGDVQARCFQSALGRAIVGDAAVDREFALLAAAVDDARRDGGPVRPDSRDQAWWHAQRRRLGTATRYPRFRLLPDGYEGDQSLRWPAIIYLHGSGGELPRDYTPFSKRSASTDLIAWATGRALPFAIYALQADRAWEPSAVLDAIDEILAEDRVDPDRICIMGFSMGGMGSWNCAVDHPERWSCVVPLGGRGDRSDEAARVVGLPVWSFNGDIDTSTTLADARHMVDAIRAAGGDPRFTVLQGVDHGGTQHASFSTSGLWEWIAQQRRVDAH